MEKKLSKEELEKVAEIIGDGYKVYGIEEKAQCLNFDGSLYVSDILKAADYIRSITAPQGSSMGARMALMNMLLKARKPTYKCDREDWTRQYECDEYKCNAHPRSCFFCDHCTDITYDDTHGPYMFDCNVNGNTLDEGLPGTCESFIEEN